MRVAGILSVSVLLVFVARAEEPDIGEYVEFDPAKYSQEVTDCDRAMGHPEDPHKVVPGKTRSEIDLPEAIELCTAAVEADPENPRLRYQLGRAYGYSGRGEEAMEHRLVAVRAGYPQSLFVIGYLYSIGQTIDQNTCVAAELFRRSAKAGRLAGQVAFPHHVIRGDFDECEVAKEPDEMLGFLAAAEEGDDLDFYQRLLIAELRSGVENWGE